MTTNNLMEWARVIHEQGKANMAIINPHDPASWPIGYKRVKSDPPEMNMAQQTALRAVYDRGPLNKYAHTPTDEHEPLMPWRTFYDSAERGSGCIMVYWNHMWLGIEPDGYTHS